MKVPARTGAVIVLVSVVVLAAPAGSAAPAAPSRTMTAARAPSAAGGRSDDAGATAGWTASQLAVPAGANRRQSGYVGPIACPALAGCVALGQYATSSGEEEDSIATEQSGVWSVAEAPLPEGALSAANLGPYVLSCTGVGNCVGTSLYVTPTGLAPDVLDEVDGLWSALAMPLPANASRSSWPTIDAITCERQPACVIVGSYVTTADLTEGLVVTQVGLRQFSAGEAATPGGTNLGSGLESVACTAKRACVAVGYYVTSWGARRPLVEGDAGGFLSGARAPLPRDAAPNPLAELTAVSCGSGTTCAALGSYLDKASGVRGVLETDKRGSWRASYMPLPPGWNPADPAPAIFALTCRGGPNCLAVGTFVESGGATEGLVLHERLGVWRASTLSGRRVVMRAVSCGNDRTCVAVGASQDGKGVTGVIVTWSDGSLSEGFSPLPANAGTPPSGGLGFVACHLPGACVATGTYAEDDTAATPLPLVVSQ